MEKRVLFIVLAWVLLLIGVISPAKGEVLISQTDSLYSIGNSLDFNVTLSSSSAISNFLVIKLMCGDREIEIYRSPHSLAVGERKTIPISIKLDSLLLRDLNGFCKFGAKFGESEDYSKNFDINNKVSIMFYSESIVNPGSNVKINGFAKKSDGRVLEGFVEISIKELGLSNNDLVKGGQFNSSLYIPKNSKSGSYTLNIKAYDKDNLNAVANQGNNSVIIHVRQVMEKMDLAFETLGTNPGKDFVYSVLLLDQAGDQMRQQDVEVFLLNPAGDVVNKSLVFSGIANNFFLAYSAAPGQWRISAKLGDLVLAKNFLIDEYKDVSFYVNNNTLYVKNTGNVPFDGPIKVAIGEDTVIKHINLEVGALKKFKLSAPDGSYPIRIIDNQQEEYLGSALLSGDSVAIGDYEQISNNLSFWIWLVLLLILCLVIIHFYKKYTKRRYYGKEPKPLAVTASKHSGKSLLGSVFSSKIYQPITLEEKSPVRVPPDATKVGNFGKKEKAIVVALNIRNLEEISASGEDALAPIERVIESAKNKGAKFKEENNYKLFIFTQSFTKDTRLAYSTMQFLKKAENFLVDYNKKKALKIDFGLGANSGELIIESWQGKFKISSPGNTILLAKKAASRAKGESLISQALKREIPTLLKTNPLPGENFFKLNNLVDRSPQEEFLSKFMNRNKT